MSTYLYPLLDVKTIVGYMNECYCNIDISEKDFSHPEGKKWQRIFMVVLCNSCIGLTPDDLNQMPMTSELTYPDIHEDAIPLFNLLRCMQALLITCGFPDFVISDLTGPKPKRLIRLCSAFINFSRFQEDRLGTFERLKEENDALQDQRETLLNENDEMKQRINAIKGNQAEKDVEVRAINEQIMEWTEKIDAMHQATSIKQKEASEIKVKLAEFKSSLARNKEQILQAKEENSRLAAKIVPSPDRLKGEMERMQRQLVQATHTKEDLQRRHGECIKRYQLQQQRNQECDVALRCASAIQEQMDKQKAVLTLINNIQEDTRCKKIDIKQLDAKEQQLTLQIRTKQEKMEKLSMQHNMKMVDRQATVENLQKELSSLQHDYGAQHSQSEHIRMEIKAVKEAQREELNSHQEIMDNMRGKYHEMLKQLDTYHEKIGASYQKMTSILGK